MQKADIIMHRQLNQAPGKYLDEMIRVPDNIIRTLTAACMLASLADM